MHLNCKRTDNTSGHAYIWNISSSVPMNISLVEYRKRYSISMLHVNLFQPRSICFNPGHFVSTWVNWIFFSFAGNKKKFLAPSIFSSSSFFSSSPLYLPHLLFSPCSPNIPTCILFISMLTLGALNHRPLVFLWVHVLMPYHWAMQTWMQIPLFFNYIYIVVVINFLKLFKWDILIK